MNTTTPVAMIRHVTVRQHSTWRADVPTEMLTDPKFFDAEGFPTAAFDQWMCDHGDESNVEYDSVDDDDLVYETEVEG